MGKIFLGIDISKEKLNICLMDDLKIVHEDELANSVPAIKRMLKKILSGSATMRHSFSYVPHSQENTYTP